MTASTLPSLKIGDYTVTAFFDGYFHTTIDIAVGADKETMQRISGKRLDDPVLLSVNAFLIEGGGIRALVDAGTGDFFGPVLGKLPANLEAAGVALDSITHILMTHIHPDHAYGLTDKSGSAWFPKAQLVVQETEIKFWIDRDPTEAWHQLQRRNMINSRKALAPYAERTTRIGNGEFLPGLHAQIAPGHTPGHNTWTIEGGGDALMIWGDIIHMSFMQLERPDIAVMFDTDPQQAVDSRLRLLDQVSADRIRIAGMHLDFPGFGFVRREGGRYFIDPV